MISHALSYSQNYPDFQILSNNDPYPEPLFLYTMSGEERFMAIIDSNLNVKWSVNSNYMGLDFKVNQNWLTYFHRPERSWITLNRYMVELDTFKCEGPYITDYHDLQILNNGNYILQAYDSMFVNMSEIVEQGQVVSLITGILILQEFNTANELLFEWNAWENLNIAEYTNLNLESDNIEFMHGNSIDIDHDENLLISNRASNEILKINRQDGSIIWHMGGPLNEFNFINDPMNGFKMQHDVRRLDNGNISLFDNGVTHTPPISRVVEYEIDENEKIANLIWEYTHPDNILGLAMGSVQRLPNGNTLINWGTINDRGALITEVNYEKDIVLEIQYPDQHRNYKVRKNNWGFVINQMEGDADIDNKIDIFDINYLINYFYLVDNHVLTMYQMFRFDINKDGDINMDDLDYLINSILEL
ncbi:MAG: arylsulfotransferase family protein [Candidatus Neomarinimicrobiota bacterium]